MPRNAAPDDEDDELLLGLDGELDVLRNSVDSDELLLVLDELPPDRLEVELDDVDANAVVLVDEVELLDTLLVELDDVL